jgi:hypothetical protein
VWFLRMWTACPEKHTSDVEWAFSQNTIFKLGFHLVAADGNKARWPMWNSLDVSFACCLQISLYWSTLYYIGHHDNLSPPPLKNGGFEWTGKLIPFFRKRYQFPVRNTKWLKNGKLRSAILSAFYNISQRNIGILLILWCSFKLW